MMGTETGIIGHLRAGGSRSGDARPPRASSLTAHPTPISSFLRQRSSAQPKMPIGKPANHLKICLKAPSLQSLGLKSPLLGTQSPLGLTSAKSKFAWMDESFLGNLRRLLEDSEAIGGVMKDTVSWKSNGDAFTVRDKAIFATHVAPKYFSIMSISTFRMVALSWGFTIQVDPSTGSETYQHCRFLRSSPSKCQNATMQEMKDSTARPSQVESKDSSKQEDPLLLLAATASASNMTGKQEETSPPNTVRATEKTKTSPKKQVDSSKPSVVKARRSSISSVLSASAGRRSSLGLKLPPGNPLRRSLDQQLSPSEASSATLKLLQSSRKTFDRVVIPPFSRIRMPSQGVGPHNPFAGAPKIGSSSLGNSSLGQFEKRVRLLKAQASLTSSLQLLMEDPIAPTPDRSFLSNLRGILEHAEKDRFTHIVSWMKHGRSFRIYHENEFTQVVYPRLTNGSPLANVEETLKEYGFIKLSKGREKEAYFHPLFVRDLPMLGRGKAIQQWKTAGWKGDSTPEFFL
ncbi:unnamed protein product [Cylindrotheca closterium]|uniref:HSF-type DNA-binding domain-containing protein n=1 Tax=Cylindrotheca closterium TaxID=2856 RepID=A0AAD2CXZ5_9STRA|nr:unnamed protein product [Cylindrotheca closterium]